jgi:hypothetical protein
VAMDVRDRRLYIYKVYQEAVARPFDAQRFA